MDKTYIRVLLQPNLKKPTLVAGFPGVGNIGVAATRLLANFLETRLFAELYSPAFPDYTAVDPEGICSLLKCSFYEASERNLVILIGDAQPPPEDVPAYYEICGDILDFVEGLGCNFIIVVDGFPSNYSREEIYVAGSSKEIVSECLLMGAKIYTDRIIGLSGLLLGLAKLRRIEGLCILSPAVDLIYDEAAAFNAYRFLRRILGLGLEKTI